MANCKYCGSHVEDDENAGMDDDFQLYHPSCEEDYFELGWVKHDLIHFSDPHPRGGR